MIKRVYGAYFSGTGTTEKIVRTIGKYLANKIEVDYLDWDFTLSKARNFEKVFEKQSLVIFATPVIAGRVPNLLLKYLKMIKGKDCLAVPVVVYGNRDYDDALMELRDILKDGEMNIVAGCTFIGEHSFSNELASGRPDKKDLETAEQFSELIYQKIIAGKLEEEVDFPGTQKPYRPYYQPIDRHGNIIDIRKVKPKTDRKRCNDCKLCVNICPLNSIEFEDVSNVTGICMKCCGCIKKCPQNAKYFDDEGFIYHKEELEAQYAKRKEPEIFA